MVRGQGWSGTFWDSAPLRKEKKLSWRAVKHYYKDDSKYTADKIGTAVLRGVSYGIIDAYIQLSTRTPEVHILTTLIGTLIEI